MKYLILIIISLALFPTVSVGQIVTGGGSFFDNQAIAAALHRMSALTKHLKVRDSLCGSPKTLKHDDKIVQVYLKLSMKKTKVVSSEDCDEEMKYFTCLADSKTKEIVAELKDTKDSAEMLSIKLKISHEQAKRMLNFYSTLGEK